MRRHVFDDRAIGCAPPTPPGGPAPGDPDGGPGEPSPGGEGSPEGNGGAPSDREAQAGEAAPRVRPVREEQWERLRAPFEAGAYRSSIEAGARFGTKAIVRFELGVAALEDRLDAVLDPGQYATGLRLYPAAEQPTVTCHLQVGRARRGGVGQGSRWRIARERALVEAALALGIGRRGARSPRVVADVDHRVEVPDEDQARLEEPYDPPMRTPGD